MCLVAEETRHPDDGMRCSGDRGRVDAWGRLLCGGREDRQIKRWGHRVNLDHVEQVRRWRREGEGRGERSEGGRGRGPEGGGGRKAVHSGSNY